VVASLYYSFTSYDLLRPPEWIGLANYDRMLTSDPLVGQAIWVTIYYSVLLVPASVIGSLACAMLLNTNIRGRTIFRALFFIPSITPVVATVFIWTWMLNPHYGLINYLLGKVGIDGPSWLGDPTWALPSLVMLSLWGIVGGTAMITFLAALQGVPQHLYEAAELDGAGTARKFLNITLPMITPTIFFNLVLGVIGSFQAFTVAYIATDGGPAQSTYFYVLHLYYSGFRYFEMGYASALAWGLLILLLAFTYLQFRASSKWVYYEAER